MSTSIVTSSGSRVCTFCSASSPLRAVPATRNSPELSRICEIKRRMNALSSTTSTDGGGIVGWSPVGATLEDTIALLERSHLYPSVVQVEMDAPPVIAADVLGDDRHAIRLERLTSGSDIAIADVDAARRQQIREHARAADELRPHPARVGAETHHLGEERHDRRRRA